MKILIVILCCSQRKIFLHTKTLNSYKFKVNYRNLFQNCGSPAVYLDKRINDVPLGVYCAPLDMWVLSNKQPRRRGIAIPGALDTCHFRPINIPMPGIGDPRLYTSVRYGIPGVIHVYAVFALWYTMFNTCTLSFKLFEK